MSDHSLDACLQLVADRRRRRIIDQLRDEAGGRTTFDDLVDRLHGTATADGGTDQKRIAVRLHHTDLPKLADHGVVEYDRDTGVVEYRSSDRLEAVLDALPEEPPVANA